MTGALAVAGLPSALCAAVEVEFAGLDGVRREPLRDCWGVRFERVGPVRRFPSFRGQRNWPGLWWFATTGEHVGYESWVERDALMALDADRDVVAVAAQPMWLHWVDGGTGRAVRHAPDFFVRRSDGGGVVIDVRPDDRIPEKDAAVFAVTARICAEVGWDYRRVGELAPVAAANLRWLSGYRHPRCARPQPMALLREVFAVPTPLLVGAGSVGDPIAVLPVLFAMLWRRELVCDLDTTLLGPSSRVRVAALATELVR